MIDPQVEPTLIRENTKPIYDLLYTLNRSKSTLYNQTSFSALSNSLFKIVAVLLIPFSAFSSGPFPGTNVA